MLRLALLAVTLALASASLQANWAVFKHRHGKSYSPKEDVLRLYIYQANMKHIEQHNERFARGETSFYLAENHLADLTTEELISTMNGMNLSVQPRYDLTETVSDDDLPSTVDWRQKGYVTPVKDQGQCGSCWAFSTTGSLEGQHFKATGQLVSLSESNLVDCSRPEGNMGCRGGLMDQAFQYVIDNKGIDTEASYPYVPETERCHFNSSNVGATVKSFQDIERGSESDLQRAVATVGPVSIAIDASQRSFHFYAGGVYDEPRCSSTRLDHGVLVVGYGTDDGQDYWLVKNSWSERWGVKGYIQMSRNKNNQCGVASSASYPVV